MKTKEQKRLEAIRRLEKTRHADPEIVAKRRYGLEEKRFSLFNANRWNAENPAPSCCHVVPILKRGGMQDIEPTLESLRTLGSVAKPGWMTPEGIVVWHSQSKQYYKVLLENDELPKGAK
jgi:hypothetical protein